MSAKYTVAEIAEMRGLVESLCTRYNVSYNAKERALEVNGLLQAHVTNGTSLDDLRDAVQQKREHDSVCAARIQQINERMRNQEQRYTEARAARLAALSPSRRALEIWFEDCIIRGGGRDSDDLYNGSGKSLISWMKNNGEDGLKISRNEMESFLTEKGISSKTVNGIRRFDASQVIFGSVRSGNFMT